MYTQLAKPFLMIPRSQTLRVWPLFLKIAQFMSKTPLWHSGKTYNIGYTFWNIKERNPIFCTHIELKKSNDTKVMQWPCDLDLFTKNNQFGSCCCCPRCILVLQTHFLNYWIHIIWIRLIVPPLGHDGHYWQMWGAWGCYALRCYILYSIYYTVYMTRVKTRKLLELWRHENQLFLDVITCFSRKKFKCWKIYSCFNVFTY